MLPFRQPTHKTLCSWSAYLLLSWLALTTGAAHPVSLSTVVVNVQTNLATVEMKILVEDLMLFQELQPNSDQVLEAAPLRDASQAHQAFLLKYFQVRDVDGVAAPGKVNSLDTEEIPEEGVQADAVMATSVYYELEFALPDSPQFLTFSQNFGGDANPLPSVMDLIILQNSARVGYPVQISPANPYSVELDWENPPTNDRKSWRERRKLMQQRREDLLGITSYSTTYSYLYLTEQEIRHEILVPVLTLESWLPIPREDPNFLTVAEQTATEAAIESYFQSHSPVKIDGLSVPAKVDRVDYYGLNFRDFAQRAPKQRVSTHSARAGIILYYPTKQAPQSVALTWDIFNQHTPLLNTVVYDHRNTGYRHFFTPAEPDFQWTTTVAPHEKPATPQLPTPGLHPARHLPIVGGLGLLFGIGFLFGGISQRRWKPALVGGGLCCAAIGTWQQIPMGITMPKSVPLDEIVTETEAQTIFSALHANIYRAFDYGEESQIYDVLAESVSGELLESLYLSVGEGLRMEEQGGAIARVTSTSIQAGELQNRRVRQEYPEFDYRCTWNVAGTVEHWGHIHTRENQYQAVFTVTGDSEAWKITQLVVENEERLAFQTGIRELQ